MQSKLQILFTPELTEGKSTRGVRGTLTAAAALRELLAGTGLVASRTANPDARCVIVSRCSSPSLPATFTSAMVRSPQEHDAWRPSLRSGATAMSTRPPMRSFLASACPSGDATTGACFG